MLSAVEKEVSRRNILPGDIGGRRQTAIEAEDVELSKGKKTSSAGLIVGLLYLACWVVLGYSYAFGKVKSKYSDKVHLKYNEDSRKRGSFLFFSSLLLSVAAILYRLITEEGTNM